MPARALLPCLLALLVIRLWLMPLPSSFWLDEIASIFVAQHGSNHPSLAAAAPQAWRSWYYPAVRLWATLFGFSEVAARIPSILAMAGCLALLARLSKRLIHPDSGWFVVIACLALPGINYQAANARPYALGMCAFAAGLLFLVRWLDSDAWLDALLFVACAGSVLYIHLLFWPCCLVFVLYAAWRIALRQTPVPWYRALAVFALLGAAILPVAAQMLTLLPEARQHVIAPLPSPVQFVRSLELTLVLGCAVGAWMVARLLKWQPDPLPFSASAMVLIAGWWLFQPVLLFGYSWLSGDGVFVPRYLQLALPGAALMATALTARFIPSRQWKPVATVAAIGVLIFLGHWRELWPRHHNSDWRAAAQAVNNLESANAEIPVLCPSPFVEARPPVWRPDYPLPGFLYAHLSVYPIHAPVSLLPFENSPEAEAFASTLAPSRRFLIYGWEPQVHYWRDWFSSRAEFAGWRQRRIGPFADVDVVEFEAPGVD
jgi:mannosyltransferase